MKHIDMVKSYIAALPATTLQKDDIAIRLGVNERTVREAISQLCGEGITWYPAKVKGDAGVYLKLIGKEIDYVRLGEELHTLLKGLRTAYFRKAIKYKALLKDHAKQLKYPKDLEALEQLEFAFEELEREGN